MNKSIYVFLLLIIIMLLIPKATVANYIDTPLGQLIMFVFLILAINENIFFGLLFLMIIISFLNNTFEGMTNNNTLNKQKQPVKQPKTVNSEDVNEKLNDDELNAIKKLLSKKCSKVNCKKKCGNALLSCLDGCKLSEQMRKPISSKDINVSNNSTTENVEPNDNAIEEFTLFH